MSSGQRCQWSQASPLGSWQGEAGSCSHFHQSLFQLPPSTWWAEVAVPHTKPSGKRRAAMRGEASGGRARRSSRPSIRVMFASSRFHVATAYGIFRNLLVGGAAAVYAGTVYQDQLNELEYHP